MKKIFQFHLTSNYGGTEQYMLGNWKEINKDNFLFHFATYGQKLGLFSDRIGGEDLLRYISCGASTDKNRFISDVRRIFKEEKYDAVHLHTNYWGGLLLEELALEAKIPKIIVHSHNTHINIADDEKRKCVQETHEKIKSMFSIEYATDFCACSNVAADWLFGPQIPRDKIRIMKNAINIEKFLFDKQIREKYRRELGLENCFVIGNVGRLSYQKNQKFLIDIFGKLEKKINNARLILIGEGPLEVELKQKTEELGIQDKIMFLGMRKDVNNLLQAMDVFCLPSRFEGLPIVLVEAVTAGLECLASALITEEVSSISNNITRIELNEKLWIDKLIGLSDGYERKNMTEIITEAGYNIKYQIKEIERMYEE